MDYIVKNYDAVNREIQEVSCGKTKLLAVSKTFPKECIEKLYKDREVRAFAESRLNELKEKAEALPKDIVWHYIGKIQSNKLKKIARIAKVIHSVETVETIETLADLSGKENLDINYLIEVNISGEASKSGVTPDNMLNELLKCAKTHQKQVKCIGFMTMAPLDATAEELDRYFGAMQKLLESKRDEFEIAELTELSMGMSGDYLNAIAAGSTIVRVGTAIFGRSSAV